MAFLLPASRLRHTGRTHAKKQPDDPNDPANLYRDTVALPQSSFDQRANAIVREPQLHEFWETERIYQGLHESRKKSGGPSCSVNLGAPLFFLLSCNP